MGSTSSVRQRLKNLLSLSGGSAGEEGSRGDEMDATLNEPGRFGDEEDAAAETVVPLALLELGAVPDDELRA